MVDARLIEVNICRVPDFNDLIHHFRRNAYKSMQYKRIKHRKNVVIERCFYLLRCPVVFI